MALLRSGHRFGSGNRKMDVALLHLSQADHTSPVRCCNSTRASGDPKEGGACCAWEGTQALSAEILFSKAPFNFRAAPTSCSTLETFLPSALTSAQRKLFKHHCDSKSPGEGKWEGQETQYSREQPSTNDRWGADPSAPSPWDGIALRSSPYSDSEAL